jgi:hypothetical protein
MPEEAPINVRFQDWILRRKIWVYYLIVNWRITEMNDLVKVAPTDAFYTTVSKHLNAYLEGGTMPPADIAPAILNLADDHLAGRELTMRAGDYLAIRNHMRANK